MLQQNGTDQGLTQTENHLFAPFAIESMSQCTGGKKLIFDKLEGPLIQSRTFLTINNHHLSVSDDEGKTYN